MSKTSLQADRDWMNSRLAETSLSEFDRVNALAMMSRGVLIGSLLASVWRKFKPA